MRVSCFPFESKSPLHFTANIPRSPVSSVHPTPTPTPTLFDHELYFMIPPRLLNTGINNMSAARSFPRSKRARKREREREREREHEDARETRKRGGTVTPVRLKTESLESRSRERNRDHLTRRDTRAPRARKEQEGNSRGRGGEGGGRGRNTEITAFTSIAIESDNLPRWP